MHNKKHVAFSVVTNAFLGAIGGWALGDMIAFFSQRSEHNSAAFRLIFAGLSAGVTGLLSYNGIIEHDGKTEKSDNRGI